jgi:hypothetical protein
VSRTAIALALCLLVAGCAAPTAQTQAPAETTGVQTTVSGTEADSSNATATTDTTSTADRTTTAAEADGMRVTGGSLRMDPEQVFDRTVALLDTNASPPGVIAIESAAEVEADTDSGATPGDGSDDRSFAGVMCIGADASDGGAGPDGDGSDNDGDGDGDGDEDADADGTDDDEEGDGVRVAAYAPSAERVVVNERMTTGGRERALERTLAHEFVHTVQFRQDAFERLQRELDLRYSYSLDRYLTYASVVEGTAVFVAGAYDEAYLAGEGATLTSTERYEAAPSGVKFSVARYYFGSRYLDSRFDSAENVSQLYDDPPQTTEQLLHEETKGSEEPRFLAVQVRPDENRSLVSKNTNGELFTRIALGTELNESRTGEAAAGWGADELAVVEPANRSGNRSFVWATRWDSPDEADEFATALEVYIDSRAERLPAETSAADAEAVWRDGSLTFRTVRVSEETVLLLAGEESFVKNAGVSGANASVSVSVA